MLFLPHSFFLFVTSALAACVALFGLGRRKKAGGWAFVGLMTSIAIWMASAAIEAAVVGEAPKVFWSQMEYVGYVFTGVFLLFFALHYTQQAQLLTPFGQLVVWMLPILSLLFVWTNPWHHTVWTGFSPGPEKANVLIYHRGPIFWFIAGYTYVFSFVSCYVFYRARKTADPVIRRQLDTMLLSAAFPFASGALYLFGQDFVSGMDVSPFGFSIAGLIIAWGFFHFHLLDIAPVGRTVLVEKTPDGMVVFDDKGRLVDSNPAAHHMLGIGTSDFNATVLLSDYPALYPLLDATQETRTSLVIPDGPLELDVRMIPLTDSKNRFQGRLLILQDITTRMVATRERDRVIAELREALAQIKALNGLLPICCSCKKIRDDSGYWQQIEAYIREHADVEFSHGLCPDCTRKLYPDLADELLAPAKESAEPSGLTL